MVDGTHIHLTCMNVYYTVPNRTVDCSVENLKEKRKESAYD